MELEKTSIGKLAKAKNKEEGKKVLFSSSRYF